MLFVQSLVALTLIFSLGFATTLHPSVGHTSLNITKGDTVDVWVVLDPQNFISYYVVAENPNGTCTVVGGVSNAPILSSPVGLNTSTTMPVHLDDLSEDSLCIGTGGPTYFNVQFKPEQAGSYVLHHQFHYISNIGI
ncbi:hypothetical protein PIIN_02649 [Serendipita indica DSM 11827]|uniref:Uncharacterized protein n=1 Tax=Serendipita indica (strain DSM 11827) TaxID=1109443 RepID=G4TBT6_SERID|nr:hypothetical protein PIIN_02649 [Serendipita indica DSM 11827]